mgnify:FL=1|jgi:hypothetical protein
MADFEYLYYELSRSIIADVESVLLKARRTDIRLVQGGSKFQPLSVKSHARKPSTAGFLLTVDEKAKLDKNSKLKEAVGEDRAHIITTSDELIDLLEKELGSSLRSTSKLTEEVVSVEPSVSSFVSPSPMVEGVEPSVVEPKEEVKVEDSLPAEQDVVLPVDDGFGLTIEEEVQVLRAENNSLKRDLKQAQQNSAGVSTEEVDSLKKDLETKTFDLNAEREAHSNTKDTLTLVEQDFEKKKFEYAKLEVELDEVKAKLKEGATVPVTPLSVPKNVEIYVTASSLDLVQSYHYLLLNMKNTLVIDLSPESVMDTLVRLTKRNRVGKWLLGEQNIRALYSPYDEIKTKVADGLELLTSPNALLPVNFLSEVEWERKLEDLSRLNCKVVLYLGLETNRGVFEFLSRLDKQAKVLRSSSPLSERAWKRVVRQYEGSVEEVAI